MKTPLVLLDPLLRELIHGEVKNQGCIVFDAADERAALSFAALYPGAIDLAVTDLPQAINKTERLRAPCACCRPE